MLNHMILGQTAMRNTRPDLRAHARLSCQMARMRRKIATLLGFAN